MLLGRNHSDTRISTIFQTKEKLSLEYMLGYLFEYDLSLKVTYDTFGGFDRSKSAQDFEKKIKELLDDRDGRS